MTGVIALIAVGASVATSVLITKAMCNYHFRVMDNHAQGLLRDTLEMICDAYKSQKEKEKSNTGKKRICNQTDIERARAGIGSANIIMDEEFNIAMKLDAKKIIAVAFLDMSYKAELLPEEKRNDFIAKKAHQMKAELSGFIDAQAELISRKF